MGNDVSTFNSLNHDTICVHSNHNYNTKDPTNFDMLLKTSVIAHKPSKPDMSELNDAENTISNTNVILKRSQAPEKVQKIRLNPYANSFSLYTPIPEIIKNAKLHQDILDIGGQNTQCFNYHGRSALNPHAKPFVPHKDNELILNTNISSKFSISPLHTPQVIYTPPIIDKASPSTESFSTESFEH